MCTLLVEIQLTISSVKCNKCPQGAEILRKLHMRDRDTEQAENKNSEKKDCELQLRSGKKKSYVR